MRGSKDGARGGTRGRGRPRSEAARRAVLEAARALLDEGGVSAVTMEGLAARAGVGKATIYRSWPNAHAVVMAALIDAVDVGAPVGEGGTALGVLRRQLHHITETFSRRAGRGVALLLAAADPETELWKAFRHHFILARRDEGRALLAAAVERGELRPDLEIDVALDLIYAPVFYRLLVGHAPLDGAFTDAVLDHALRGLGAGGRGGDAESA